MIDQDTIVRLGEACEHLLGEHDFNMVVQLFEAQTLNSLLSTKRDDTKTREELYATIQSVRDLLDFMRELTRKKDEMMTPVEVDPTDDPRVHDIYDYEE